MKKVVIIGAGIGGLATANLLAASGYEVSVYEKNSMAGGRAGTYSVDGFTFDTGPSWYLMPEVFAHYFELLGEDVTEHLDLLRLDPAYKVFFENYKDTITIHADVTKDKQTFEQIEQGAGKQLEKYLKSSENIYTASMKHFLYTNFSKKMSIINTDIIRLSPRFAGTAFMSIDTYVNRFFSDKRLRQIMEYPMVFLGTSPFEAPAIYSLMSHMDFKQGVFYPRGGMYTIIEALVRIGTKLNVTYHYDSEVSAIRTTDGQATGIALKTGETVPADIVISNADLHFTETNCLKKKTVRIQKNIGKKSRQVHLLCFSILVSREVCRSWIITILSLPMTGKQTLMIYSIVTHGQSQHRCIYVNQAILMNQLRQAVTKTYLSSCLLQPHSTLLTVRWND